MADTNYTPGGCAGGCGRAVRLNRVLCDPCSALVHTADPFHFAAATECVSTLPTLRHNLRETAA